MIEKYFLLLLRIHVSVGIQIGKNFYPCSFTVLDQPDLEFIFGLDMLRKHQVCDLDQLMCLTYFYTFSSWNSGEMVAI